MTRVLSLAASACLVLILFTAPSGAQNSVGVQALEAQLREAERAGLSGPEIEQLREMLEYLKREERDERAEHQNAPTMRQNYFDAAGISDYGDCGRYDDRQAFSFCASARNAFQSYVQAFNEGADANTLATLYAAHEQSGENLVLYLDGGVAPTRETTPAMGSAPEKGRKSSETARAPNAPESDGVSNHQFDRIKTGSDGGTLATTSKGRVYEPQPETFTGEKGWFSDRDRAVFLARLQAVNRISENCRKKDARADRPSPDQVRNGNAPPRWSFSVPDCQQGGWKDNEWRCRATVAANCYWD